MQMIDWEPIPMPTEEEKRRSVDAILDGGIPRRQGMWRQASRLFRAVPLSALFFGVEDCLALAVLLTAVCAVLSLETPAPNMTVVMFLLSPLLFALLYGLTEWKDAMSGTLEWKQTSLVTARELTALRSLLFGGVAVVTCVSWTALLWNVRDWEGTLPWMLGVAYAGLFLYAALALACRGHRWSAAAPPLVWAMLGCALLRWDPEGAYLRQLPAAAFFLAAAVGLAVCLCEIRMMLREKNQGGITCAFR